MFPPRRPAIVALAVLTTIVQAVGAAWGQIPDAAFEAASVKPNRSTTPGQEFRITPDGSYTATNATVRMLIRQAFRVQDVQIVDAPDWMAAERFDITARAPAGSTPDALPGMLQALLQERFGLAVRRTSREMPVYAVVRNRKDGALGPRLMATRPETAALCAAQRRTPGGTGRAGDRVCGISVGGGTIAATDVALDQLLTALSPWLGRIAVDRTGLTGTFDFDLQWTPEQFANRSTPAVVNGLTIDPNGPSLFTAVQEQLGLRLDSTRGPVDVLVIERIERPAPD